MKNSFRSSVLAVSCAALTACVSGPTGQQDDGPVAEPTPTLEEAADGLAATLAALERVLQESIPAEDWEQARGGYRSGCPTVGQGRFVAPQFIAPARQLPGEAWSRIEQTLAESGFQSGPPVPLRGGSGTLVHFANDVGDEIAVSSIPPDGGQEGGSGYRGETACHEGHVR